MGTWNDKLRARQELLRRATTREASARTAWHLTQKAKQTPVVRAARAAAYKRLVEAKGLTAKRKVQVAEAASHLSVTRVSSAGVALVASYEEFSATIYRDAVNVPTLAFGETDPDILAKYRGKRISRAAGLALLQKQLDGNYGAAVRALNLPLNQHQYDDALVSFVYNVGTSGIAPTTGVGRALRAHQWRAAADHLPDWDKAGGKPLLGLTRRRRSERALFLKPV